MSRALNRSSGPMTRAPAASQHARTRGVQVRWASKAPGGLEDRRASHAVPRFYGGYRMRQWEERVGAATSVAGRPSPHGSICDSAAIGTRGGEGDCYRKSKTPPRAAQRGMSQRRRRRGLEMKCVAPRRADRQSVCHASLAAPRREPKNLVAHVQRRAWRPGRSANTMVSDFAPIRRLFAMEYMLQFA